MPEDAFRALADPTRQKILELLHCEDLTAGQIASHFDMAKPSISNRLSVLRAAGLVTSERHGQSISCHLDTTVLQGLMGWILELVKKG